MWNGCRMVLVRNALGRIQIRKSLACYAKDGGFCSGGGREPHKAGMCEDQI